MKNWRRKGSKLLRTLSPSGKRVWLLWRECSLRPRNCRRSLSRMQWMMGFQTIWILNLISLQNSWPSTLISTWKSHQAKREFRMKTWLELLTKFWFFLELWKPKISLKNFIKEDYAEDFFWKNRLRKILRKWWFWSSKQNVAINSLQKLKEC